MYEHCASTGEWLLAYYDPTVDKQYVFLTTTGAGAVRATYPVIYFAKRVPFAELLPLEWLGKVADDENICSLRIRIPECSVEFKNYDL